MQESHQKGLATCSAQSFALSVARRSAKRKQGYRWAGQSSKTGNLATLQAAVSSAHAVEKWAQGQEFASVNVLTDEAGPVTIQQIKSAIKAIVEKGTIEQLFVYFSGHGVNIRYGEYWLLSVSVRATHLFDEQSCVFKLNG